MLGVDACQQIREDLLYARKRANAQCQPFSGLAKEGVLIQFNDVISECLRKPSGKARLVIDVAANKSAKRGLPLTLLDEVKL